MPQNGTKAGKTKAVAAPSSLSIEGQTKRLFHLTSYTYNDLSKLKWKKLEKWKILNSTSTVIVLYKIINAEYEALQDLKNIILSKGIAYSLRPCLKTVGRRTWHHHPRHVQECFVWGLTVEGKTPRAVIAHWVNMSNCREDMSNWRRE